MTTLIKNTRFTYVPGSAGVPGTPGSPATPSYSKLVVDYVIPGKPAIAASTAYYYVDTGVFNPLLTSPNEFGNYNSVAITSVIVPARGGTPSTTVYKTVTYPGTPAVAPTPGVLPTPEKTLSDFNLGWNTGGISRAAYSADMVFSFSVPASAIGVVTGLNNFNAGVSYEEIKFGIYFSHGLAIIYESGVQKGSTHPFVSTDVFYIRRVSGVVTYSINSTVIYTSAGISAGALFADSSLYAGGDAISGATFAAVPSLSGAHNVLRPLAAFGATGLYAKGAAVFPAFTSTAGAYGRAGSYGFLPPLTAFGANQIYASGTAVLSALTSFSDAGELAPTYAVGIGTLAYVISAGRVLTGEIIKSSSTNALRRLTGFGANHNYAAGAGVLAPLDAYGAQAVLINGILLATLTNKFLLKATGTERDQAGVNAAMPMLTLQAYSGAGVVASLPMPRVRASGTFGVVARVLAAMPMPQVFVKGSTGGVAKVTATLTDAFTVSAYSGAVVTARTTTPFSAIAKGSTGGQGVLRVVMPLFRVDARGSADSVARISAAMPMLRPVPSAVLRALAPRFSVVASGHVIVQAVYEAYSVNLILPPSRPGAPQPANQTTHYTNFPFNQIVRHGDRYYGVSDTGLYLLGGDTDVNAPIPWAIKTAKTDFGGDEKETVKSAYVGGTIAVSAVATVYAGEKDAVSYSYPVPQSATKQNWRVKFGRGLKTRYFALGMSDSTGGAFAADDVSLETDKLGRKL